MIVAPIVDCKCQYQCGVGWSVSCNLEPVPHSPGWSAQLCGAGNDHVPGPGTLLLITTCTVSATLTPAAMIRDILRVHVLSTHHAARGPGGGDTVTAGAVEPFNQIKP